jgi:hypothetical protein
MRAWILWLLVAFSAGCPESNGCRMCADIAKGAQAICSKHDSRAAPTKTKSKKAEGEKEGELSPPPGSTGCGTCDAISRGASVICGTHSSKAMNSAPVPEDPPAQEPRKPGE